MIWRVNVIDSLRAEREQLVEVLPVQLHEHRVAQRDDCGGSRLARVQTHLADDFAARHFAHHALRAVVVAYVNAQPPADTEIGGVASSPCSIRTSPSGQFDPLQMLLQEWLSASGAASPSSAAKRCIRSASRCGGRIVPVRCSLCGHVS